MTKQPWDGYCQPGHAYGSHRLRLVARLRKTASVDHDIREGWQNDRSCCAWHHYDDILTEEMERALEDGGGANVTPVESAPPGIEQCTLCDGTGSYTQEGCFTGGLNDDGSGCGWYEQIPCECKDLDTSRCSGSPDYKAQR